MFDSNYIFQGLTITETLSQVRGRCFTLSTKKRYTSGNALLIPLKKDGNPVLTIIHTVGETFWMNADFWPDEPGMETFEEPTHCTVVEKVVEEKYENCYNSEITSQLIPERVGPPGG